MSNYLGPATVTVALKLMLEQRLLEDIPFAVNVTTSRPDEIPEIDGEGYVNLYLYQATPNTAWRNQDLPTRARSGQLVQKARLALDLHYLVTFSGNDNELQPQRLMGSTLRILHEQPILNGAWLDYAIGHVDYRDMLGASNINQEVEQVKFTPQPFSLEEMSKLWSVLIQAPYRLSVPYVASVIFLDAEETVPRPRAVLERTVIVEPFVSLLAPPEPDAFAGLALWLRSDKGVSIDPGSGTLEWADHSPHGRHASQDQPAQQPRHEGHGVGTHPVFHFDGQDDYFRVAWSVDAPVGELTAAAIVFSTAATARSLISFDESAHWGLQIPGGDGQHPDWISTDGGGHTLTGDRATGDGRWHLVWIEYDGSAQTKRLFSDGVLAGEEIAHSGTIGSAVSRDGRLGVSAADDPGQDNIGSDFFAGDLAELVIYDRRLTTDERQQLERYFAGRYGHG